MNKIAFSILMFVSLCTSLSTYAEKQILVGGIKYTIDETKQQAIVIGASIYGDITIPPVIRYQRVDYPVIGIRQYAFNDAKLLSSIKIPGSLNFIGEDAFENCENLNSVYLEEGIDSIGSKAFENCTSLSSITLPNSIRSIGWGLFIRCSKLQDVNIPSPIRHLPNSTFYECKMLRNIPINDNITSIGEDCFGNCIGLTEINIPSTIKSIGRSGFVNCKNITTITLSEGIENVGEKAFQGCEKIKSVTIPASVKTIGNDAFNNCENLIEFIFKQSSEAINLGHQPFDFSKVQKLTLNRTIYYDTPPYGGYEERIFPNVETLFMGGSLKSFPTFLSKNSNITTVYSMFIDPSILKPDFHQSVYQFATLYIPVGTKEAYIQSVGWKKFFDIQEMDEETTPIASVTLKKKKNIIGRYNASGQKLNSPQKGINIIKYSDGTTKKVIIK